MSENFEAFAQRQFRANPRGIFEGAKICHSGGVDQSALRALSGIGATIARIPAGEVREAISKGLCDIAFVAPVDTAAPRDPSPNPQTPPSNCNPNAGGDDVFVVRNVLPEITPLSQTLSGRMPTATLLVRITDPDDPNIRAFAEWPEGQTTRLTRQPNTDDYTAEISLPEDFDRRRIAIVAEDKCGEVRASVVLLRQPFCERGVRVSSSLVQGLQEDLRCLGYDPKGIDGVVGPNSCAAIADYLGKTRYRDFYLGNGPAWNELAQQTGRECRIQEAVDVELDPVDGTLVDAQITRVRLNVLNPGPTASVEVRIGRRQLPEIRWPGNGEPIEVEILEPGQRIAIEAAAKNARGRVIDKESVFVTRAPVSFKIDPPGPVEDTGDMIAGRVVIESGQNAITRLIARGSDGQSVTLPEVAGSRIAFSVPNAPPGGRLDYRIVGLGPGQSELHSATFTVIRPALPMRLSAKPLDGNEVDEALTHIVVDVIEPGATKVLRLVDHETDLEIRRISYDGGPWTPEITMPDPGEGRVIRVEALDGSDNMLDRVDVQFVRPRKTLGDLVLEYFPWVVLALGGGALAVRTIAKADPQAAMAGTVHIRVKNDPAPEFSHEEAQGPKLTLVVAQQDGDPVISVEEE
ncbi:MAG: hypothetical protein AAF871_10215 [Pseudomonadota bacterium]